MNKQLLSIAAVLALNGALYAGASQGAPGGGLAAYSVTTLTDETDGDCTDTASLSLYDAISCSADGTAIDFNVTGTIQFSSGYTISNDLNITGPGSGSLDFANSSVSNIFTVDSGVELNLSKMTINNAYNGTAIINSGTLNISDVNISANTNSDSCTAAAAGIINSGSLTIVDSNISDNYCSSSEPGAVYNSGNMTLSNVIFFANESADGAAAIYNSGGATLTVADSNFSGNIADNSGTGAVDNEGTMTVTGTSFENNQNTLPTMGGAAGIANSGTLTISDSSFTGNDTDGNGGAINADSGTVNITDTSFSGNYAQFFGGAIYNAGAVITILETT